MKQLAVIIAVCAALACTAENSGSTGDRAPSSDTAADEAARVQGDSTQLNADSTMARDTARR